MNIENRKPFQHPYNSRRSKERFGEDSELGSDVREMYKNRFPSRNRGPFTEIPEEAPEDRLSHKLINIFKKYP